MSEHDSVVIDPRVLQASTAVALTAHYFGRVHDDGTLYVQVRDVAFLLSGQMSAWSAWATLPPDEQHRIARLWLHRDPDLAIDSVVRHVLQRSDARSRPGIHVPETGYFTDIELSFGRLPLDIAAEGIELLAKERVLKLARERPVAAEGEYVATLYRTDRGEQPVDITYQIGPFVAVPEVTPLGLGDPAEAEELEIPVADLRDLAARLDDARGETYRVSSLDRIFRNLEDRNGSLASSKSWRITAGDLRVLHAPTGFGKSVLTELVACWCVENARVMTILVATNAAVIKTAHEITGHLEVLGLSGHAVPLTSPRGAQVAAETALRGDTSEGGVGEWAMRRMGYGCALVAAADAASEVDAWIPGSEPCTGLRAAADERGPRHRCPWFATCGKFRAIREAGRAPIVVTTFLNWLQGVVQVPVAAGGVVEDAMPVQQLLLHRSHIVVIDEVDEFQASMIKKSAGSILLGHEGGKETALQRISTELEQNRRRLGAVRGDARSSAGLARELADRYVWHLADGTLQRLGSGRSAAHPLMGRWLLAQRWDTQLAAVLFGVPEGELPSPGVWGLFHALFDEAAARDEALLPAWLLPVREALRSLQINAGFDPHHEAHATILDALLGEGGNRLTTAEECVRTADRLIRRAYLTRLTRLLTSFIYLAPHLEAAGVTSARDMADTLRRYRAWHAAPLGPLGRTLFAFSENYDPDRIDDTSLRVNAFGGDPHEYVRSMGETTALALLGHRRCVVGLSATAYFPGAPHHHVFIEPTWWVPDSVTGGIDLAAAPISDEEQEFIRVSGTSGQRRRETMQRLGSLLWTKHLRPELDRLAADPETSGRLRLLLATTSYEGAEDIARGVSRASGLTSDQIVLAVPSDADQVRPPADGWTELPGDQLEQFGQVIEGTVLIAPLARAARGINLANTTTGESLVGSIWLIVRPVPIIDEPAEILAHVHASAKAALQPTAAPSDTLEMIRTLARRRFDEMFNSLPYFTTLPREVRLGITAENLIAMIQLAGRGRRGGTSARIRLVDYAFFDDTGRSGLPRLIQELRRMWVEEDHRHPFELIERLYGDTIATILDFAARERRAAQMNESDRTDDIHEGTDDR